MGEFRYEADGEFLGAAYVTGRGVPGVTTHGREGAGHFPAPPACPRRPGRSYSGAFGRQAVEAMVRRLRIAGGVGMAQAAPPESPSGVGPDSAGRPPDGGWRWEATGSLVCVPLF